MHARTFLAAAALTALALRPALARELDVVTSAPMHDALRETFVAPFANATGFAAQTSTWAGGMDALRERLKPAPAANAQSTPAASSPGTATGAPPGAPPGTPSGTAPGTAQGTAHGAAQGTAQGAASGPATDLIELTSDEVQPACEEGLLEKLDFTVIGGKDHYLPQAITDCGVGAAITAIVLAWDKDKFPSVPTWADFWDVAKYPGKRGLHDGVRGNLEIALMADGVAPGDVYKTLSSNDGVERAFRKLDQLRPYIVWWHTGAEAAHLMASGDALMTSAPSNAVVAADHAEHRDFAMQWVGNVSAMHYWAIVKGSPNLRQALQFLYFAGTPAIQARLQTRLAVGGTAKGETDFLTPDQLAVSPGNPANLAAGLRQDTAFWHDNLDKLRQRFATWQQSH